MIFHHALDQIYGQKTRLRILRQLVHSGGGHSGREIARRAGVSPMTCHEILADLLQHGILDRQRVGASHLYTLRDEHVLVRNVLRPAFQYEARLLASYAEDLYEALSTPVVSLILFGSTVRKEERATSDVDLLAVVPDEQDVEALEDEAAECAYDLSMRYGNSPQLVVYSSRQFQEDAKKREVFVQEVLRTGQVVHGLPMTELLSLRWPRTAKGLLKFIRVSAPDIQQGEDPSAGVTRLAGILGFFRKCAICSSESLDVEGLLEYLHHRYKLSGAQEEELSLALDELPADRGTGLCPYHDEQMSKDD